MLPIRTLFQSIYHQKKTIFNEIYNITFLPLPTFAGMKVKGFFDKKKDRLSGQKKPDRSVQSCVSQLQDKTAINGKTFKRRNSLTDIRRLMSVSLLQHPRMTTRPTLSQF